MKTILTPSFGPAQMSNGAEVMTMIANTCVGTSAPVSLRYAGYSVEIDVADEDYEAVKAKVDALNFTTFMVEPCVYSRPGKIAYAVGDGIEAGASWVGRLWAKLLVRLRLFDQESRSPEP